jgi:hypothetical protein
MTSSIFKMLEGVLMMLNELYLKDIHKIIMHKKKTE